MTLKPTFKHSRLVILWGAVLLFSLSSVGGWFWLYNRMQRQAFEQKLHETQIVNDAFTEHTEQVFKNVDLALAAVREAYLHTSSIPDTERFIARLPINNNLIDTVYLINASGYVSISQNPSYKGIDVRDRDFFLFHLESSTDELHIGSVEHGRLTGQHIFFVTRRIGNANGSFAGVVLVALNPGAFSEYYRRLNKDTEGLTSLIGIEDRKIRVRVPEPADDAWQKPVRGSARDFMANSLNGHYRSKSSVDGIDREFVYRRVGDLPLIMVTAFSDRDVAQAVTRQIQPITIAGVAAVIFAVGLAGILTIVFRQREEMSRMATIDGLTGLLSRHHFMVLAERELGRARRYATELSVLMIDVDHFKSVNDTHGHQIGDKVLERLGEIFRSALREIDCVGRIGGEEFAVILPQTPILKAFEVAERTRRIVEHGEIPMPHGLPLKVSISIGVCSLHDPETNLDTLLGRADQALYHAKHTGRNQVCVYEIAQNSDADAICFPEALQRRN